MCMHGVHGMQQRFDDILHMMIYFCSCTCLLLGGLALQGGNIQWGQTAGMAALPLAALPFAAGRAFHAHTV